MTVYTPEESLLSDLKQLHIARDSEYTKIVRRELHYHAGALVSNDIAYYIRTSLLDIVVKALITWPTSHRALVQYADYVVNTRENKFIKCRQLLTTVVDKATNTEE